MIAPRDEVLQQHAETHRVAVPDLAFLGKLLWYGQPRRTLPVQGLCHLRTSNARIFVETVAAIVDKATKRSGLTALESGLVYDLTAIDSRNDFF